MSTVFISHASEDRELAEDIYHALERAGYTAHLDKKALAAGQEYNLAIQELVEKSEYFVFLISPESVHQGAYALTELLYAETKWRRRPEGIVPVMIREVNPKALPAFLRQITYFSPKGNATAEVISELNKRSRAGTRDVGQGKADRVARAKVYFEEELDNRLVWYERAARFNAIRYRTLQILTIFCAAAVSTLSAFIKYSIITASLGALLVVMLVLGILGNYQVKFLRYRLTAERMKRERRKYINLTVPYTVGLGENRAYEC